MMKTFAILGLGILYLTLSFPVVIPDDETTVAPVPPKVDDDLLEAFKTNPKQNIILTFKAGIGAVFKLLLTSKGKGFNSTEERIKFSEGLFKENADKSQTNVLAYLKDKSAGNPDMKYNSNVVFNIILIQSADLPLVEGLKAFNEINEIKLNKIVKAAEKKAE